jgi:predicted PurR-regulated permease PerM
MMNLTAQNLFKLSLVLLWLYILAKTAELFLVVLLSVMLAVLASPVADFLANQRHLARLFRARRSLSILTAFLLIFLLAFLMLWLVISPLAFEAGLFIRDLPHFTERLSFLIFNLGENAGVLAMQLDFKERLEYALRFIDEFAADFWSMTINFFKKITALSFFAASRLFDLALIPVLAFYFLRDYDIMLNGFLKLFPSKRKARLQAFLADGGKMLADFVYGQIMLCASVGICTFIALSLLGVKYPLLLGFVAAVLEAVPVIGPFAIAIFSVGAALTDSLALAGKTLLFCLLLQLAENNLLAPRIMGESLKIPPAVILLSLLAGGRLLGITGMLIALPAAAAMKLVIEYFWNTEES